MAEGLRKSSRPVRIRKNPDFVYDSDSVNFLLHRVENSGEIVHHRQSAESVNSEVFNSASDNKGYSAITTAVSWVNLFNKPTSVKSVSKSELGDISDLGEKCLGASQSHSEFDEFEYASENVNSGSDGGEGVRLDYSSTRLDFLDLEGSFLSVSPANHTNTSIMPNSDTDSRVLNVAECACTEGNLCEQCNVSESGAANPTSEIMDLVSSVREALGKMDKIANEVSALKVGLQATNVRLGELEAASGRSSVGESSANERRHSGKQKVKVKDKKSSVDAEKERTCGLMKEKLRDRRKAAGAQQEAAPSSDEDINLQVLKKKMTKKQRQECGCKVAACLKASGAVFPQEEYSTCGNSDASGEDSEYGAGCKSRRKVKSGAKISKRPVVQTELWPHTIANEEDGEELSSEDIGLAKFLSCFSYILVNCGRAEAAGRAVLFQAISSVLECLPWADARAFHNLVMLKIEQGRIDWSENFLTLADKFLDRRVRLNLRSKGSSAGSSAPRGSFNRGVSRGSGSSSNNFNSSSSSSRFSTNRSRPLNAVICHQWNTGTCSYGDNCKRWHVCLYCAEGGKLGEPHKSSSHNSSAGRGRQPQQNV